MFRRVLFWVIMIAAAWLATTHGSAVSDIVASARYGSWQFLALAAVLQVAYFATRTAMYRASLTAVGVRRSYTELVVVHLSGIYLSTVVPGASSSGRSLLAQDSILRGYDADKVLQMPIVARLADFTGFAVVMFAGFGYLFTLDSIHLYEVVSAAVVLGVIAALAVGLTLAVLRPVALTGVLGSVERGLIGFSQLLNRPGNDGWAQRVAGRYADTGRSIAGNPGGLLAAVSISAAAYAVDLLSFIAVGFALGWPAFGALVASFAVGMLVWLVSVVPQGIGVVEAVIALMLASFGADAPTALAISLAFRGLTFWLPMLIGSLLVRRVEGFAHLRQEAGEVFPVRLAAVATFFVGVMNLLSALTPAVTERLRLLERILPLQSEYGRLSAALAGVALILLSRGLWRRKRLVWVTTVAILSIGIVSHLAKGLDYEEAIVSAVLLVFLLVKRREFRAGSDAPSIAQGLRVLAGAFAVTLAYGTLGFFLLDRGFGMTFTFWPSVRQTVAMFTEFYDPGVVPHTRIAAFFADSIYVVGAAALGFALFMLLRPVLVRAPASPAEKHRARSIVEHWGRTPLAALGLLPDKSYFFSSGGSLVAYRLVGTVVVALGDPIGPAEDAARAIVEFADECGRNDWIPAFYQTLPDYLAAYEGAGFTSARIGHDAVVDAARFSLSGKHYRVERNLLNRLTKEGYLAVFHPAPVSSALLRELRDVSDSWLAVAGGSEMSFSLGWFDEEYLRGCGIMTVEGPQGEVEAFANVLPEFSLSEVTVDLMRYRPSAPEGVMDFTFIRLIEWARDNGYETFNLGFSALSGVGELEDPAVERILRLVYEYGNRFYSFKGLYGFKRKFGPEWQPRYLVYPDAVALPAVFSAIVRANSGGADTGEIVREWAGRLLPS